MDSKTKEYPVIWLQCATCTGCLISILNSVSPTIKNVLIDEVIPGKHVNLRFNTTVMAGAGALSDEGGRGDCCKRERWVCPDRGWRVFPRPKTGSTGPLEKEITKTVSMVDRVVEFGKGCPGHYCRGNLCDLWGDPGRSSQSHGLPGGQRTSGKQGREDTGDQCLRMSSPP